MECPNCRRAIYARTPTCPACGCKLRSHWQTLGAQTINSNIDAQKNQPSSSERERQRLIQLVADAEQRLQEGKVKAASERLDIFRMQHLACLEQLRAQLQASSATQVQNAYRLAVVNVQRLVIERAVTEGLSCLANHDEQVADVFMAHAFAVAAAADSEGRRVLAQLCLNAIPVSNEDSAGYIGHKLVALILQTVHSTSPHSPEGQALRQQMIAGLKALVADPRSSRSTERATTWTEASQYGKEAHTHQLLMTALGASLHDALAQLETNSIAVAYHRRQARRWRQLNKWVGVGCLAVAILFITGVVATLSIVAWKSFS